MRRLSVSLILAATDLSGFFDCEHKTFLELAVIEKRLERPGQNELERKLLEQRGVEHEKRVLESYRAKGLTITTVSQRPRSDADDLMDAARETEAAMATGVDVISQGVLFDGAWLGRPDFLVRQVGTSRFGSYAYEVVDAKLARHAKASAILQLCAYTEQLGRVQDCAPEYLSLALGNDEITSVRLRTADYMAFYRQAKRSLEAFAHGGPSASPYPEPVEHCGVCPWWKHCEERRRQDDHLSLVAGLSHRQQDRLALAGVTKVVELASLVPEASIAGITNDGLRRIREQAALQVRARNTDEPLYKLLLDTEPGDGLEGLPVPKPGDLFLDIEGDPFVRGEGLEYLFGLLELGEPSDGFDVRDAPGAPRYRAFWATNALEEKSAFEAVIDRISSGLEEFRDLHVFHFGHRENDALKRLSCRHHTREDQVDNLLRRHVLVDLHRVIKQSVQASVEAYTLKALESLHHFQRAVLVRDAAKAMQWFGWWLETGEGNDYLANIRTSIERYNEDDCRSTWKLRDWLEARRVELEAQLGHRLRRPQPVEQSTGDTDGQRDKEMDQVIARLVAGLPDDPTLDSDQERTLRLVSNILDWHWREAKSSWWEYFRTLELPRDERVDDRGVLGGLRFVGDIGSNKKSRVHRYEFPEQEHRIREGDDVLDPDTRKRTGEVVRIGDDFIELKRNAALQHPDALILDGPPKTEHHRARLLEIGKSIATFGLHDHSECALARALLLRHVPELGQLPGASLIPPEADTVRALGDIALRMNGAVLAVQGPPGSGKTYQAAHVIVRLVAAGKRVGITANSHKVVTSLMAKAVEAGREVGVNISATHNPGSSGGDELASTDYVLEPKHEKNIVGLLSGEINVLGGTTWAWTRPEFRNSVDLLIIDEAGQLSLANALAVSMAAKNLMLFGDPAQLDQPQKGAHPPGAEVSALEHLLGENLTIPDWAGVFLAETRRLHPDICKFTSEVFYEGRLKSVDELEQQRVIGPPPFDGAGLRFVPVAHHGNTNRSDEEVETVAKLILELFESGAQFIDRQGLRRALTGRDVLVVAPYNAQVAALRRQLPADVAVGTVDKFQGQQAPVVIYSMTASSAEDAPRGMEFLYSLNRLNVATSRAQALVILVASPELTRARCKTPRQMKLANALCSYIEHAQ